MSQRVKVTTFEKTLAIVFVLAFGFCASILLYAWLT